MKTARLYLRRLTQDDIADFIRLHADPLAMRDYPAPLEPAEAQAKLDSYLDAEERHGFTRLHISSHDGTFLGYTGLMKRCDYPLEPHVEIGWRFLPAAWGKGYATEAATAVLYDAFHRLALPNVLAYTAPENLASQAVMKRLALARREDLDFTISGGDEDGRHGLVWEARPEHFNR